MNVRASERPRASEAAATPALVSPDVSRSTTSWAQRKDADDAAGMPHTPHEGGDPTLSNTEQGEGRGGSSTLRSRPATTRALRGIARR